jgi:phosphatidylserine/phosphatidylglycerophosphate/cardiolipin synthase-like enzyme
LTKSTFKRHLALMIALVLLAAGCTQTPPPTQTPFVITATPNMTGTPPTSTPFVVTATPLPGSVTTIAADQLFGAAKGFWQVYFTAPTGSRDAATYVGGVDEILAEQIGQVQLTLDIVAYEFNSPALTQAVLAARARGVRVRVVTDDDAGLGDDETTLNQFVDANIPVVTDERSAYMHNKFMILDSAVVWTGSWNYTINDTYRNNNNVLALRSQTAVQNYQTEFNEMFIDGRFGPTSPANTPRAEFNQDGAAIGVYFSAEDDVIGKLTSAIQSAQHSVRFMTFSFTVDTIAQALMSRAADGVDVSGIFERTGSQTQFSKLTPLFCAGLFVRQDGNPFVLHHKVFIIDGATVLTGSFNVSANATDSNDENLISITDPDLAAQYLAEFDRRWAEASTPTALSCP